MPTGLGITLREAEIARKATDLNGGIAISLLQVRNAFHHYQSYGSAVQMLGEIITDENMTFMRAIDFLDRASLMLREAKSCGDYANGAGCNGYIAESMDAINSIRNEFKGINVQGASIDGQVATAWQHLQTTIQEVQAGYDRAMEEHRADYNRAMEEQTLIELAQNL
ncbi:MAG: hypothetical protein ISS25_01255 [Nanoarchaeota archaeon]|nr:hypothetical protein [DPANN group archaeon]MBL7116442.1 hypothetical protein [Nanoarchaeota archaeon]